MNQAVIEWVTKAEGDFATAGRELRARKNLNYDAVCFHCQQCAEKYLKAVLQVNNIHIPKIHYLLELLALMLKLDATYEFLRSDLDALEAYSVRFRYPGDFAEKDQAHSAYESVKVIREFIRRKLNINK